MKLVILSMLVATSLAAPAAQSLEFHDDGSYRFYYETGREGGSHTRSEVRNPDGVVIGKFSFEDPDGEIREVNYRADESGFVAQGDVSVKGAPKGQLPVEPPQQPEQPEEQELPTTTSTPEDPPTEQQPVELKVEETQSQPEATHAEYHDEEDDKDDMQDLALEESAPDDPPEAFPPGFFLQKFQGLRRLPEPTKKPEKPAVTEAPKEEEKPAEPEKDATKENQEVAQPTASEVKTGGEANLFAPLAPFPGYSPPEWATSMFHQPVYVFAYHQPDSYGYHYFY